ncbi:MAG TPA: 2Fe-2S iron-sulfur cluster-binding protein, partial [Bacillota bacterium]|nr:2Fe-2S iron-sulfur cluster-binding protein [Bacillota bacterium]
MSVKVTIITENKNKDDEISRVLTYSEPVPLLFALRDVGIYIYAPCGGVGTCGKCRVRAGGDIAPLTAQEKLHLTQREIDEGIRLACRGVATSDTFVYVPSDAVFDGSNVSHCANIAVRGVDKVSETAQYGLSIDFGTTTVAARLYKLPSGEFIGEAVRQNPQALYGADIISRIV